MNGLSQNMRKTTAWHTRVWDEWVLERNSLPLVQRETNVFTAVPQIDTLHTLCDFKLYFYLSTFVNENSMFDVSHVCPTRKCEFYNNRG